MFEKIKSIFKTKDSVSDPSKSVFSGFIQKLKGQSLDDSSRAVLKEFLYRADVGTEQSEVILSEIDKEKGEGAALDRLRSVLVNRLKPYESDILEMPSAGTSVIVMIGINGAGKTTTIAKLAQLFKQQGKSVLLAAGDTFRAAAIEQLGHWAREVGVDMVSQKQGSDSASVVFDAFASAKAKGVDVLIADTAGRLHTKDHLLVELEKIIRVLKKQDEHAPQHIWLVVDGTIGQSSIEQARVFASHVPVTGLVVTKLDSRSKAGSLLRVCDMLKKPVVGIGTGEGLNDLYSFQAEQFVDQLLEE
jgi:fused signal recognition particle receptor